MRWLAQLVVDIRDAGIADEPLLVGALARDLLLHYGYDIAVSRATRDIDFAIAVADWPAFESLRAALLAKGRFTQHKSAVHRLRHVESGWIDLLPFGAIERSDGTIAWPPSGDEVMSVIGYREADATAIRVSLPQTVTVRVVSLPMLCVLKLLAWKDRHTVEPGKDAIDLWLILRNYLDAGNMDRLYGEMAYLLTDDFDIERTGAWLAGNDASTLLKQYSDRAESIVETMANFLDTELDLDGQLTLITQMNSGEPDKARRLLAAFYGGLIGTEAGEAPDAER